MGYLVAAGVPGKLARTHPFPLRAWGAEIDLFVGIAKKIRRMKTDQRDYEGRDDASKPQPRHKLQRAACAVRGDYFDGCT